jgi:uncharacterized protein (DUF983 family)
MRKANCPSCGAPVIFRGAASIVAVCEMCRSTLVLDGASRGPRYLALDRMTMHEWLNAEGHRSGVVHCS